MATCNLALHKTYSENRTPTTNSQKTALLGRNPKSRVFGLRYCGGCAICESRTTVQKPDGMIQLPNVKTNNKLWFPYYQQQVMDSLLPNNKFRFPYYQTTSFGFLTTKEQVAVSLLPNNKLWIPYHGFVSVRGSQMDLAPIRMSVTRTSKLSQGQRRKHQRPCSRGFEATSSWYPRFL